MIGVLLLVGLFRSSSALASAYGIAVTGTMVVTACMAFIVIWKVWKWSPFFAGALMVPFLVIDTTFLAANLLKVIEGGWVPLAFAAAVSLLMYTWQEGTRVLFEKIRKLETPLDSLVAMLEKKPPLRVPGTAVFLTSDPNYAPTALMHSLKHYKVLHENNVILSVLTAHTPRVAAEERVKIEPIGKAFSRVTLRFGYIESPNVPRALGMARKLGWQFDIMSTSFFLSRRLLKPAARSAMPRWQDGCSSRSELLQTTHRATSTSRRDGWSRSAPRSRSRAGCYCPSCGASHEWFTRDAWMCEPEANRLIEPSSRGLPRPLLRVLFSGR